MKLTKMLTVAAITLVASISLTACRNHTNAKGKTTDASIALVTNNTGVDDHSFNQSAWQGLQKYAKSHD